jgi:hypothetical protein
MPHLLQEFCSSRGLALRIDRDAGLLRGVKLLGLASKNGREYPEATLARAAALYEGAKVNVNHPKGHPLAPRDYQDRLGTIRNVVARPGEGLFGDLQYNRKHALAEQLVWDAEHAPENVGFSHNVQARTAKRGDQTIVEEILAVQSVDLVADPATTRGLFESETPDVGSAEQSEAHAEVTQSLSSVDEQQQAASRLGLVDSAHPTRDAEIEQLREQVKTLQAAQAIAHKRAAIAALLVEHGLPPLDARDPAARAITSDSFVESLFGVPDEGAMRRLIRERATLVEQARRWPTDAPAGNPATAPRSREQTLIESHTDNSLEAFLKAIRA